MKINASTLGGIATATTMIMVVALALLADLNANWLNGVVTGMSATMFILFVTAGIEGDL